MKIEARGIGTALNYFDFRQSSNQPISEEGQRTQGNVKVISDLTFDQLNTMYLVKLVAFDTAYPSVMTTATATVRVNRNVGPVVFNPSVYVANVTESAQLGSRVEQVTATDTNDVHGVRSPNLLHSFIDYLSYLTFNEIYTYDD